MLKTSYRTLKRFLIFKDSRKNIVASTRDTSEYRRRIKEQLVNYKGGRCVKCGYNKCLAALEFHHCDPKQKDFSISGGTRSFETLKKEVDKCILVCSNCHKEIHQGLLN